VPLPTILNGKTVDPQLDSSPAVLQLEVRRWRIRAWCWLLK
jgi:hypothetical protein